uniref:Uncharacterized protein n=1 Tax=Rhizophora mucronata TaxID=61149 RepID=A0A2P2MYR8_RHIMU
MYTRIHLNSVTLPSHIFHSCRKFLHIHSKKGIPVHKAPILWDP